MIANCKKKGVIEHVPPLRRGMGSLGALMLTLSALSPTIGVFVVGADVIHQAGLASFACFAAAALLGVAMAFVYAELVSAFPETGAEYTMLTRTLGPVFGFAALGLNLANFTVAQALSGLGVADYLGAIAPGCRRGSSRWLLVAAVTGLALLNVRFNALLTGAFLALEAASLVVVTGLGFGHPHRAVWAAMTRRSQPGPHSRVASLAVMGSAAAAAVYAFDGYGGVVSFGEEVREAPPADASVVFASPRPRHPAAAPARPGPDAGAPDAAALAGARPAGDRLVRAFGGERLADALGFAVAAGHLQRHAGPGADGRAPALRHRARPAVAGGDQPGPHPTCTPGSARPGSPPW